MAVLALTVTLAIVAYFRPSPTRYLGQQQDRHNRAALIAQTAQVVIDVDLDRS